MKFMKGLSLLLALTLAFTPVMVGAEELEPDSVTKDYWVHTITFEQGLQNTTVEPSENFTVSAKLKHEKEKVTLSDPYAYILKDNQILTEVENCDSYRFVFGIFEMDETYIGHKDVTSETVSAAATLSAPDAEGKYKLKLNDIWPVFPIGDWIVRPADKFNETVVSEATLTVKKAVAVESVTVTPDTAALKVGETKELKAEVKPAEADQKVTWSSDKPAVATVDENGKVTAVSKGEAIITATSVKDNTKKGTAKITVTEAAEPGKALNSFTLKTKQKELTKGDKFKLEPVADPADAVEKIEWTSKDEKVATVDKDGNVTAVGVGKTTIVAVALDKAGNTKGDTCDIDVKEAKKPVKKIKVSVKNKKTKFLVGNTTTAKAKVTPKDADVTDVTWVSSDKTVATVDKNGKITAMKAGKAKIYAKAKDGSGVVSNKVEITVVDIRAGVSEIFMEKSTKKSFYVMVTNDTLDKVISNKKNIVTVSKTKNGKDYKIKVTAEKNTGKATITLRTKLGLTKKITVYVKKATTKKFQLVSSAGKTMKGSDPIRVKKKKRATFTIKATPDESKTKEKAAVSRKPDKEIATATIKNGKLTVEGLAKGKTIFSIKIGGVEDWYDIHVKK